VARKFEPLGDRVVVKPTERDETTKSGLVLPDTARERPQEGSIVAVGPGDIQEDGKRKPMDVNIGDVVVYSKFAGTEMKEEEDDFLILRQSDILAKVTG
jgi:chaperonin GroES